MKTEKPSFMVAKWRYVQHPRWLMYAPINPTDERVWLRLFDLFCIGLKKGNPWIRISRAKLAERSGLDVDTLDKSLKRLKEHGLITTDETGRAAIFRLVADHAWYGLTSLNISESNTEKLRSRFVKNRNPTPKSYEAATGKVTKPLSETLLSETERSKTSSSYARPEEEGPNLSQNFGEKSRGTKTFTEVSTQKAFTESQTHQEGSAPRAAPTPTNPAPNAGSSLGDQASALLPLCPKGSTDLSELAELARIRGYEPAKRALEYLQGKEWAKVMTDIGATKAATQGFNIGALVHFNFAWNRLQPLIQKQEQEDLKLLVDLEERLSSGSRLEWLTMTWRDADVIDRLLRRKGTTLEAERAKETAAA